MTNFITKYLPGQVMSAAVFGMEPFGAKQSVKMKHNSKIPLHQNFPTLTVITELECPKKHQQLSYNNCNAQILRLSQWQPGFGKYDVMTLDNCLPLQDPSLLAINGFAVPQTAKLAEKRKLIEEIAHNDVKKVSLELDLM